MEFSTAILIFVAYIIWTIIDVYAYGFIPQETQNKLTFDEGQLINEKWRNFLNHLSWGDYTFEDCNKMAEELALNLTKGR
jgi:hypothetical protein